MCTESVVRFEPRSRTTHFCDRLEEYWGKRNGQIFIKYVRILITISEIFETIKIYWSSCLASFLEFLWVYKMVGFSLR